MAVEENIKYGQWAKNNKVVYNMDVFGDWVRYHREDINEWTLQEAANNYNEKVRDAGIKDGKPITASGWRLRYELLGKTRTVSGDHTRRGSVKPAHCEAIALTLGLPLADVMKQAGFIPPPEDTAPQAQANRSIPSRNGQKPRAPHGGYKADTFTVQIGSLAENCLQIQAKKQNLSLTEYAQSLLERQSRIMNPYELRELSRKDRNRLMAQQAEEAAPLYEADLARPIEERELTAFTALDGEPIYDDTP